MDEWPFALVGLLTNKDVTGFLLLVGSAPRIHCLIYKHMLRSGACLLTLRPLGLVPASGLLAPVGLLTNRGGDGFLGFWLVVTSAMRTLLDDGCVLPPLHLQLILIQ